MSGIVAAMTDNLALGNFSLVFNGLAAVGSFLLGAVVTTLCIRWARAHSLESLYAIPLALEAVLLLCFGATGRAFTGGRVLGTIVLLCFTMGLQNAILTKLSNAVIRTTHLTGMITDIGIALGRIASGTPLEPAQGIESEFEKIQLLSSLIALFFVGGVTGALGFKHTGFFFTFPLAAILLVLAIVPVVDDLRRSDNMTA
jgi:uncharacterized membrane protein YoaK (UPF0700 family)